MAPPIEELAQKKNYIEICYLLLHGELPDSGEYGRFEQDIRTKSYPHEGIKHLFNAFPDNGHPMAILSSAVSALSAFHHQHLNVSDDEEFMEMAKPVYPSPRFFQFTLGNFVQKDSQGITQRLLQCHHLPTTVRGRVAMSRSSSVIAHRCVQDYLN